MIFTVPWPLVMALHLLPTVVVVVCAWIVFRTVRIRVKL